MTEKNAERVEDIFAMVSFSFVTGMFIEVGTAGMSWHTSLISRLSSISLNITTARPYGLFRDYLIKRFKPENKISHILVNFMNILAHVVIYYQ